MLYVTTRNNRDAFTAQRALLENRGPDGGLYLPFHMPHFSGEEIQNLLEKPFNGCVAEVLNVLFRTELTSWDVDFSVGRFPVRLQTLHHRILVGETWHNPDWSFDCLVSNLALRLGSELQTPGDWARIGVRIAVLFGIFGQLRQSGIATADISVVSGDFSAPMSAWYARSWGLPIGNILCCCNENNSVWDLLCHGQLRTDTVSVPTMIPEADAAVPEDLERLIFACGGTSEVERYLEVCRSGGVYTASESLIKRLQKGLYVSVISTERVKQIIPSVFRTHEYLLDPAGALAYGGLMDYRAKTGQTRHAVILSEKSPMKSLKTVAECLGVSEQEVMQWI